ncbi:MAG TPA: NDP-hexose 4-ketoreductase [Phycisphaerales bacterium]|nr:NDP-hexose 4-ketoreductase [Phycisphaerales bacterium]
MFERFTDRARKVMALANQEAQRFNHEYIGTEHILLGLVKEGSGVGANVLKNLDVDIKKLRLEVEKLVKSGPDMVTMGKLPHTPRAKKVIECAIEEARSLNHNYIGTEHLLLGLLRETEGVAAQVLMSMGLKLEDIRQEVLNILGAGVDGGQMPSLGMKMNPAAPGAIGDKGQASKSRTPALDSFGRDLTVMAAEGELDPVIGRKTEIERLIQILCRRTKNNPVLIGEAGVGKTAIVEGLAQRITDKQVPELLRDRRVVSLDLALMVAGTKYRGQFEERIKAVMDEIKKSGNILLFIDEIHTIVGAGAAEGAIDASNILKPALSRGDLQCIGATTLDEYRKHIEKDAALERRFQKVMVAPPSTEESLEILKGLQGKYEDHHSCKYSPEALRDAVYLSDRYITGRYLPDKAIDLIDEAGAKVRIAATPQPEDITKFEEEIEEVRLGKEEAIGKQEYEKAAKLRDKEKTLRERLQQLLHEWESKKGAHEVVVTAEDVAHIVSRQTGIPLTRLTQGETEKVLQMEETLKENIIGQDEAVTTVCRSIRRSRADIKDPYRPIGAFLFLGPTGVGKTLLAKQLAIHMFGGEDALIQLDMSEYMEKFAVSRMTGSPPGYVGYEEGGQLTERVRQRPYSVILFDEVEKAHPDVMNILLQILEEGRLTDAFGRKIDFRNTIVIMTSNLGADLIRRSTEVGFAAKEGVLDYKIMQEKIDGAVKKSFKPEFINRIDGIVIFRPLDREQLLRVIDLEVKKVLQRLARKKMHLVLDQKAKELLVEKGFNPEMGARPLRRVIEQYLEDPLAEKILLHPGKGGSWLVTVEEGKIVFVEHAEEANNPSDHLVGSSGT